MKILLLNQFGGASGAPTGRILAELGEDLARRGHEVRFLTTDPVYGKSGRGRSRMLHEGLSHGGLIWKGICSPRADAVISLTSPACLAVTAGFIARLHRARHFHWVMDLYPDVGVRLGELREGGLVRLLRKLMRGAYARAARVVTLDEDMRDFVRDHYGVDSAVLGPFPPEVTWPENSDRLPSSGQWLYSGNFGRAHEIDILLRIQKGLESRGSRATLVLQGQGAQFQASQETAAALGLQRVIWRAPVPQDRLAASLLESDALVVTRKAEMKGLLLPSKLMLAELSGRAVLWIGDTDGKTAQRLAASGRHGVFSIDQEDAITDWLAAVLAGTGSPSPEIPRPTSLMRQEVSERWDALLNQS